MSEIQVLVSTMFNDNTGKLAAAMNIKTDYLIINQCCENSKEGRLINSNERGLSNSRNTAVENASGDICVLADDDEVFADDYDKIIVKAYRSFPDADIICFKFIREHSPKSYGDKPKKLGYRDILKVSSCEVTFRREALVKNKIRFDTLFGAGAKYPSGEENLLLRDCLKKGMNIYFVPEIICKIEDYRQSTWFEGYNEDFFKSKGALMRAFSPRFSKILNILFAIKKHKAGKISFCKALKFLIKGSSEYNNES